MALEIERKFLLKNNEWAHEATESISITQGYLSRDPKRIVRVRVMQRRSTDGGAVIETKGTLTVKGINEGAVREEFEYDIAVEDAKCMLEHMAQDPILTKIRYLVPRPEGTWEVDIFGGELEGLELAEIELTAAEVSFELPEWIGEEVTDNPAYYNSNLLERVKSEA